jgi:hypothetical protein
MDGALMYNGGQNSSVFYSEIYDHKVPSNGNNDGLYWNVKASVKVGSNTYSSGFKAKQAYKEANRSFWSNETSYWDAYQIGNTYN